jgi:hypothetical protein
MTIVGRTIIDDVEKKNRTKKKKTNKKSMIKKKTMATQAHKTRRDNKMNLEHVTECNYEQGAVLAKAYLDARVKLCISTKPP